MHAPAYDVPPPMIIIMIMIIIIIITYQIYFKNDFHNKNILLIKSHRCSFGDSAQGDIM